MGADGVDIRLAMCGAVQPEQGLDREPAPALLVSYAYWKPYEPKLRRSLYRDYALDSGGFSVHGRGQVIDRLAYAEFCLELFATDPRLTEVFTLDGIPGDWRTTRDNTEFLWKLGVPAIPIYHYGEPWEFLAYLHDAYPGKIGVGGAANMRGPQKLKQAIAIAKRIWPARMHALGFGSSKALLSVPWDSTDHTNWLRAPLQYGTWRGWSGGKEGWRRISNRERLVSVRSEVDYYLELERRARFMWRTHHAQMVAACPPWPPPKSAQEGVS
jgi:hypothetical protein